MDILIALYFLAVILSVVLCVFQFGIYLCDILFFLIDKGILPAYFFLEAAATKVKVGKRLLCALCFKFLRLNVLIKCNITYPQPG